MDCFGLTSVMHFPVCNRCRTLPATKNIFMPAVGAGPCQQPRMFSCLRSVQDPASNQEYLTDFIERLEAQGNEPPNKRSKLSCSLLADAQRQPQYQQGRQGHQQGMHPRGGLASATRRGSHVLGPGTPGLTGPGLAGAKRKLVSAAGGSAATPTAAPSAEAAAPRTVPGGMKPAGDLAGVGAIGGSVAQRTGGLLAMKGAGGAGLSPLGPVASAALQPGARGTPGTQLTGAKLCLHDSPSGQPAGLRPPPLGARPAGPLASPRTPAQQPPPGAPASSAATPPRRRPALTLLHPPAQRSLQDLQSQPGPAAAAAFPVPKPTHKSRTPPSWSRSGSARPQVRRVQAGEVPNPCSVGAKLEWCLFV